MKYLLLLIIVANLYCSTFKFKKDFNEKVRCSEKTLSLYIGYTDTNNMNRARGDGGLKDAELADKAEILSKTTQFKEIINKLEKSCLFKKVEFDSRNADFTMEVFIDYNYRGINWYLYFAALGSILTTGFWVIPYSSNYDMKITTTITENKTKFHWKKKEEEEEITTWFHPFLIFTSPFYRVSRAQDILTDNIVNSIVKDLSGKEFLYK